MTAPLRRLLVLLATSGVLALTVAEPAAGVAVKGAPNRERSKDATVVVSRVPTKKRVVFITIDDGFTRSDAAARRLERLGWPVTSFVLPRTMGGAKTRWFSGLGSRTEFANHTVRHPNLTRLSEKAQRREICAARDALTRLVGAHTTFFRPPGGAYDERTLRAAKACGMTHTVLWRVTVWAEKLSTWGGPIQAGDVILLHYVASLDRSLALLERELARLDLAPALLSDHLR